ncbi:MAG: hypothetical protein KIH62_004390 [Candidatus Kerfeldbacteria bacterium]|nr:hypothetical protein [Candidatus Kerfeldbacteria bacterium]
MADQSSMYDQRIYDYLRWIVREPSIASLPDAWMRWRNLLPSDVLRGVHDMSEMFSASEDHEREQMISRYPLQVIDSILPGSFQGLTPHLSKEERARYRQYVHDLGMITSSVDGDVRKKIMHEVIPHHVARSLRDTLRHKPEHMLGIQRATEVVQAPRPPHLRHFTTVRLPTAAYHLHWSVDVDPRTGRYAVIWHAIHPATQQHILHRTILPFNTTLSHITLVREPESVFETERYYTIPLNILFGGIERSAVPFTLYDDGTFTHNQIIYAQPLATVRVVNSHIEIEPLFGAVLTLLA